MGQQDQNRLAARRQPGPLAGDGRVAAEREGEDQAASAQGGQIQQQGKGTKKQQRLKQPHFAQ